MTLSDLSRINTGTIRVEDNHLVHYTGKGLIEIWKPNMKKDEVKIATELKTKDEEYLIKNNYITRTPFNTMVDIIC